MTVDSRASEIPTPLFVIPQDNMISPGFEIVEPEGSDLRPLGEPGSGLSGKPDAIAFDNTSATGMGMGHQNIGPNVGRIIRNSEPLTQLHSIISFTVCGWLKVPDTSGSGARILATRSQNRHSGLDLLFANGEIYLQINEQYITPTPSAFDINPDVWIFFAVTVDLPAGVVRFYEGNEFNPVRLVAEMPIEGEPEMRNEAAILSVGNHVHQLQRPFRGFLDHVRVFSSDFDASSSLDIEQLEAIREADLKK